MQINVMNQTFVRNIDSIMDLFEFYFNFRPHEYQKKFFKACFGHRRISGKWARQSGKSHSVAIYVLFQSLFNGGIQIIIVAPTQNQSRELYSKIRNMAEGHSQITREIKKSTETEMTFQNGSRIISLPSGPYGHTIRGYTGDIVIIEEAQNMKDSIVNQVITPMLASKGDRGQLIKIGTPLTRNHFYQSCYEDKEYQLINVTWKDCVKAGQYTIKFVDEQRENLTDIEFRTEYEAEFIDDIMSFFPSKLLDSNMQDYPLIPTL